MIKGDVAKCVYSCNYLPIAVFRRVSSVFLYPYGSMLRYGCPFSSASNCMARGNTILFSRWMC